MSSRSGSTRGAGGGGGMLTGGAGGITRGADGSGEGCCMAGVCMGAWKTCGGLGAGARGRCWGGRTMGAAVDGQGVNLVNGRGGNGAT